MRLPSFFQLKLSQLKMNAISRLSRLFSIHCHGNLVRVARRLHSPELCSGWTKGSVAPLAVLEMLLCRQEVGNDGYCSKQRNPLSTNLY